MAAETFVLEIATPERLMLREPVSEAQLPGRSGYLGVLPGHAPTIAEMRAGFLSYTQNGTAHHIAVSAGFIEVLPDKVRVLARTAERAEEIDLKRAEEAHQRAQKRLAGPLTGVDIGRALEAADRAQGRIEAARKRQ
jgi:F-type H+-transporting ATPase subunit epsilon